MDKSEKIAFKHLEYVGLSPIEYEPDGNVPPDFLINNKIAVEVRRLNQQENCSGKYKGLPNSIRIKDDR